MTVASRPKAKVAWTKKYSQCLRDLGRKGKKGRDAQQKARSAQTEAEMDGDIRSLSRTKHGESRLKNVEKFDLGDGYRLVTQLVSLSDAYRAFLFVGTHDDAEDWLNKHRNYVWSKSASDGTLDFIPVTETLIHAVVSPSLNESVPESMLDLPLLRDVSEGEWLQLNMAASVRDYLTRVTASAWQQDPNGIVAHIERLADADTAVCAIDLLELAHDGKWQELHSRLAYEAKQAVVVEDHSLAQAMQDTANSETFITWDDPDAVPTGMSWEDWMLFLRPQQKELVIKELTGPARIRGVSGSGKTCVMVHRARYLAKKYRQSVRLITLTVSTKRLLDVLLDSLCGTERDLISTSTMFSFVTDVLNALSPQDLKNIDIVNRNQFDSLAEAVTAAQHSAYFPHSAFAKMESNALAEFIEEELFYLRTRFLPEEYEAYLDKPRHGRKGQLNIESRKVILDAVRRWDSTFVDRRSLDHEGVAQKALSALGKQLLVGRATTRQKQACRFRCVLVDEVQDLSEIELRILAKISDLEGKRVVDHKDGLFLVGDGAQSIYRKSFSLKKCGINIAGRSWVLKKNYRNTRQILQAAYGLIERYEFADADEEAMAPPTSPDFSSRHGEMPVIVKCRTPAEEAYFVATTIAALREQATLADEASGFEIPSQLPICVIGFNDFDRNRIRDALEAAGIRTAVLRDNVHWDDNAVKISTAESAKGHEFHAIFIVGASSGVIPRRNLDEDGQKREASRLYVAMTRARDTLYITYTAAASPFLTAISQHCQEYEWRPENS
jgi:superfamily I DNA/RNA helicase